MKVRAAADTLREAAQIARDGADLLARAQRDALSAIVNAERQLFSVGESLAVADRLPWGFLSIPQKLMRALLAKVLQAAIHAKALTLAGEDQKVAGRLTPLAAQLAEFTLDGHGDSPGDPSSPRRPHHRPRRGNRPEVRARRLRPRLHHPRDRPLHRR